MSTNFDRLTVNTIRTLVADAVQKANSGHPGLAIGAAPMALSVFKQMRHNPANPSWRGRDRFVLSAGHASMLEYSLLHLFGYDVSIDDIKNFRQLGSKTAGHPEYGNIAGIEATTGPLGQGFAMAVGMAMAGKLDEAAGKASGRVYALLGDGELQEGLIWEAAMAAAHYKLDNLCAIVDWNGLQIDGKNEDVMTVAPIDEKFQAFGFHTISIDGHDFGQIFAAFDAARACKGKPTVIIAKTHKGRGVSFMEDQAGWHGKAPNEEEAKQAVAELGGEW